MGDVLFLHRGVDVDLLELGLGQLLAASGFRVGKVAQQFFCDHDLAMQRAAGAATLA
jgi:hypothetical protein